ncbi:unnamed protein product [Dovyalis caffra]|uniref:3'-5' exonuclease domain-containing protein n=1 Tax=Dovyalis caffra TaxID=77055 RepID=A0AAV1RVN7_9ROSI|nr:unnamed protein product [Dovyalis caffra]
MIMEKFDLRCDYNCSNQNDGYDVFDVQCDDMHCNTIITGNPPCLLKWIRDLLQTNLRDDNRRLRVSMDMIWHQFLNDTNIRTPVTIQFCHESRCIIYHVSPPENFPRSNLERFLNHDCVDFVGFGMQKKVQYLGKVFNLKVKNWFDIPFVACCLNPELSFRENFNLPLPNMVFKEFSKCYPKPTYLLQSNWRLIQLSSEKVMYATLDCYFAYKLAVHLSIPRKIELEVLILS